MNQSDLRDVLCLVTAYYRNDDDCRYQYNLGGSDRCQGLHILSLTPVCDLSSN